MATAGLYVWQTISEPQDDLPRQGETHWLVAILLVFCVTGLIFTIARPYKINWSVVFEHLTVIVTAFYVARKLAKLSGTALWLPPELRDSVDALMTLLGEAAFWLARNWVIVKNPPLPADSLFEIRESAALDHLKASGKNRENNLVEMKQRIREIKWALWGERHNDPKGALLRKQKEELQDLEQHAWREAWVYSVGFLLAVFAILAFGGFISLRALCVVAWDPRDWLAGQRMTNALDRQTDLDKAKQKNTVLRPLYEVHPYDSTTKPVTRAVEVFDPDLTVHLPDFVDIRRHELYKPFTFPKPVQDQIDDVGKLHDADGLTYMLAHEPDEIIDMIETQCARETAETNSLFLALDALIIAFGAAALACTFDLAAAIVGMMA